MTWNYRVIEFKSGDETHRAIHEVYYDEAGKPNGYAENPASVFWYANEDPGAASQILEKMQVALMKPMLTENEFSVPADQHDGVGNGKFEVPDTAPKIAHNCRVVSLQALSGAIAQAEAAEEKLSLATPPPSGSMKAIVIGIMPQDKIRERFLAIARGEYKPKSGEPKIWFTSMRSLAEVLSDENRSLLQVIKDTNPQSITSLAETTGRKPGNLSRTLKTMSNYGIVEMRRERNHVRPVAMATEFRIVA